MSTRGGRASTRLPCRWEGEGRRECVYTGGPGFNSSTVQVGRGGQVGMLLHGGAGLPHVYGAGGKGRAGGNGRC